ncbi:MAG: PGF-CTERM sorting domain-containing protein [Haloarculaceae archaeon]
MRRTVPADGAVATLRAFIPVALGICLLVTALAATPAGGASPVEDGTRTAVGLSSNHTANVTLYDAGDARFDGADAVRAAIENGSLEPADRLVVNETLVAVVESRRLAGAMARHNGSATEKLLGALDGSADVRVLERTPSPQVTRMYATVGAENVTAYRDGVTTYLLLDTGALTFRRDVNETHAYTVESFYRERVSAVVGFGLPAPGDWPRRREPPGPTVELISERYVTPTTTATATDAPGEARTPTATSEATNTAARTPTGTTRESTETNAEAPLPAATATPTGPESTTFETGPGFTVAGTLVALLLAALFRRRRR